MIFVAYDYINHYGTRRTAIAAEDAMPARYYSILFKGTMDECREFLYRGTDRPAGEIQLI